MARPRSDDKRNAILAAASQVIADAGVGAPTARIAREAGVAEGTVFVYFPTKDALLNALYVALHRLLAAATMAGHPTGAPLEERARHAWSGGMTWRLTFPADVRALARLELSDRITAASRASVGDAQADLRRLMRELSAGGALRTAPSDLALGVWTGMADTAAALAARTPSAAARYAEAGFAAVWRAVGAA